MAETTITYHRTRSRKPDTAPRMKAATNYPPQLTTSGPGKWRYDDELHLILHDCESCRLCERWLHHYITEVAFGDGDLKRARHVLNSASTAQKAVDDAQRKRDEAIRDLAYVRKKLGYARADLREAREDRDMARRKVTNNDTE